MSLDVELRRISKEETECEHCGSKYFENEVVFSANITHNLADMAAAAYIYNELWGPEEIGAVFAADIIEPLGAGLDRLKANPDFFKKYDAENGWGIYEDFVPWVESYHSACMFYPDAKIYVSR